ncbi:hypothetical protein C0991_009033 [Blastosporella zonata]|nr:hypothetical protein C0991_009033 [Blastosporella zonata]
MAQTTAQGSYAERARKAIPSSVNNLNLRSSSDLATQALDIVANVWSQPQPTAPPHHLSVSSAEDQWPEVGSHHEPQPTTITRKTVEKTSKSKWVPIPAHELQAAADALNPARRPKSSRPHSNSNSGSRKQTPGASSSAHSRTHSRATSVHSSPIFPRGRRLPDDPHSSPPLIVQPHLAPPPQPISIYHDPFAVRYYQPQWYNNPSPPLHSPVYLPHPTVYHHPPYDLHHHPQDLTQPQPSTSPLPLPPTLNTVNVSSIISSSTSTSRVFGSIEPSTAPYRPPLPSTTTAPCAFPQFSIGVPVGSTSIPSARNRTRRKPKPSWEGKNPDDENRENGHDEERELVDLTPRWSDAPPHTNKWSSPRQLQRLLEHLATSTQEHEVEEEMVHQAEEDHPNGPPHNIHPNPTAHPDDADHVFEVKDYGYGFGSGGPSSLRPYGYAPPQTEAYSYGVVNANGAGGSGYVSPTWERERGEYNGNGNGNGRHTPQPEPVLPPPDTEPPPHARGVRVLAPAEH